MGSVLCVIISYIICSQAQQIDVDSAPSDTSSESSDEDLSDRRGSVIQRSVPVESPTPAEPEVISAEPVKQDTPPPTMDMTVVSGEFDRVEKLREEMRSKGKSPSIDTSRQSRTTERFQERVKSREAVKALHEKRTPTPPGMSGKFSAAFNKFATTDDQNKRAASPLARAKSIGSSSRKDSMSSTMSGGSDRAVRSATPTKSDAGSVSTPRSTEEPITPAQVEKVRSAPPSDKPRSRSRYDPEPEKEEAAPKPEEGSESPRQSRAQRHRVDKNKNFNTGVPSKKNSQILDKMSKFGESADTPPKSHQTVTTKNPDTEKFQRHTHRAEQPAFDVDIQIRREPGSGSSGPAGNKTAEIRVSKDQVIVEEIDHSQPEQRDEYMNVWDTEIPVNDRREKVGQIL